MLKIQIEQDVLFIRPDDIRIAQYLAGNTIKPRSVKIVWENGDHSQYDGEAATLIWKVLEPWLEQRAALRKDAEGPLPKWVLDAMDVNLPVYGATVRSLDKNRYAGAQTSGSDYDDDLPDGSD